jgi:hypothetical protein
MEAVLHIASGFAGFLVADSDGTNVLGAAAIRMNDDVAGTKLAAVVEHLCLVLFAECKTVERL